MGKTRLGSMILASALFAWGCGPGGSTTGQAGSGGPAGSGSGGSGSGAAGTTGSAGTTGNAGTGAPGNAGTTGAAGTTGVSGSGGSSVGAAGVSGPGTAGSGATTGAAGTTGVAGGGATGGRGGAGGGGAAGRGGAAGTGTAGSGSAGTGSGGTGTGALTVQLAMTKQKIDGFGINNTWAQAMSDSDADAMFNTTNGMGFSILRVGLGSDGQPMSSNIPGDITKAKARNVKYLIGSCWSPPANCKSNNNINDGGHVLTSCYDSWSTTIANFAQTQGLYAMSIGNEPDFASCGRTEPCNGNYPTTLYTAKEMVAFVKVAGPKLKAKGIKVITPEASEWIHNWSNVSASGSEPGNKGSSDPLKCGFAPSPIATACTNGDGYDYGHWLAKDAAAWAAFDIMGVHQYDTQVGEPWPADVTNERKPVWQTEMSGVKWWPEQGPNTTIENGIAVAGWIHSALTVGEASAWLWWWWKAYDTDDNEGLYLKSGTDTKRHYTIMNYSRFVRPDYMRVDITGAAPADVLLTAFKGTDGTVVIVAINKGAAASVPITIGGGTAPTMLTPWVTSSADNCASKTAVAVSGGSFTAMLGAKTVTTFVGKP